MLIDWFTVIAQIINFLILVFLLRRFLYGPIVKMMNERRERIEADLAAAERKRREAREEIEDYRRKNEELDAQREKLLDEAREAVDAERTRLLAEAREGVEKSRSRWRQALEEEKDAFMADLRRHAGQHSYLVMRKALGEMADVSLEEQITAVFLRRLADLPEEETDRLLSAKEEKWVIQSAFELPANIRDKIQEQLKKLVDYNRDLQFTQNSDLIAGLELQTGSHKIAWTLDSYLDELEESIGQLVA